MCNVRTPTLMSKMRAKSASTNIPWGVGRQYCSWLGPPVMPAELWIICSAQDKPDSDVVGVRDSSDL
jgi:hypothetical protein